MTTREARQRALERQIARLERRIAALNATSSRITWARLGVFVASVALGIGLWAAWTIAAGAVAFAAGVLVFVAIASAHGRLKDGIARHRLWQAHKRSQLARLTLDWASIPPALPLKPEDILPIERDLDLVGEHGLHRLLDTAVSREGSLRLRAWLAVGAADPATIAARQAVVRELAAWPQFGERLRLYAAIASGTPNARWSGARLLDWLALHTPTGSLVGTIRLLTALAALNAALFILSALDVLPPVWGLSFVIYAGIYLFQVQRMGDPFTLGLSLADPLTDLRAIFGFLERARYGRHTALKALCAPFHYGEQRPSLALRRVTRVLAAASVRGNPLLWTIVSAIVPWDVYVMHALNRQRAALADVLPRWLDAWFELEALAALGSFATLNPGYAFPQVEAGDDEVFHAEAIGHPLIPHAARVDNDFALGAVGDLALITGSNMSGKSTFLRTLGINLCLAYAGGPVAAQALRSIPLRLFTCIRVTDSVTEGISYFYAEVKRLKALLDALQADHPDPLFFLIDEIFRGTNNRERLIGSAAYLRALAGGHGVGVISTHDLELVTLADELPPLRNYHFEETIRDGRMAFDYTLRHGPCPTTNALTIMRMAGLPVGQGPGESI